MAMMCFAFGSALLKTEGSFELQDSRGCTKYTQATSGAAAIHKSRKARKKK